MRGTSSFGVCCWVRTGAIPRVAAWLSLVAIVANLFAPIAWAARFPTPGAAAVPTCHEVAPDVPPVPLPVHSGDSQGLVPHCPMCLLFGGTAWAPPVACDAGFGIHPSFDRASFAGESRLALPPRPSLRPSPRAPPIRV
jgi:hypothetical protein